MKILVTYSSLTGNTKKVAQAVKECIGESADLIDVKDEPLFNNYDIIFWGFWVDKATADPQSRKVLPNINKAKIALFATLGAKPDSAHAVKSMNNAKALLDGSNKILDTFMCQGKINPALTERRMKLPEGDPHRMTSERLANHIESRKHPDENDINNVKVWCENVLKSI